VFINLFQTLKRLGVPVTLNEWLLLQNALSENLADSSLTRFYHIARAILVKTEAHFDKFDQAFLECFGHIESDEDLLRNIEEKLHRMPPLELTEEEKQMTLVTFRGGKWNIDKYLAEAEKVPPMYRPRMKTHEDLETFVDNMLTTHLLEAVARKKGLMNKKEVVQRLRSDKNKTLAKLFLQKGLPEKDTTVTDEQIQHYYQENIDWYTEPAKVRVWDIQLQTKEEAEEVLKQIRAGADFNRLAREKSLRIWAREKDGDLGYIDVKHYPSIAAAALEMKPGEIGGPVKDHDSQKHSIIKVGDTQPSKQKPLEDLKKSIKLNILRQRDDQAGKKRLEELRQEYGVEIFTEVLESTLTTPKEAA